MSAQKLLYKAIDKLVKEKSLEKITAQEILDEAEVLWRTFYKYFHDKYALVNSHYEQKVSDYIKDFNVQNWQEILTKILNYIYENRTYYRRVFKSLDQNSFFRFLTKYSYDFYCLVYKKKTKINELTKQQKYDIWYVTIKNIKVTKKWIEDDFEMKVEDLVSSILSHTDPLF